MATMQTSKNQNSSQSTVLYFTSPLTNNSIPSPLSLAYHPPSSRHLSTLLPSPVPGELSTITEIDSAYCPQCFTSWDANAAFNTAKGCCVSVVDNEMRVGCMNCPLCESNIVFTVQNVNLYKKKLDAVINNCKGEGDEGDNCTHVCFYKCGYCQWNSIDELEIYSKLNINNESTDNNNINDETEITKLAAQRIQLKITAMIEERRNSNKPLFNNLVNTWNEKLKSEDMEKRKMELLVSRSGVSTGRTGTRNTSSSTSIANTCSILNSKDSINSMKEGNSVQRLDQFILNEKKDHMTKQVYNSMLKDVDYSSNNKFTFIDLSKDNQQTNNPQYEHLLRQLTISSSNKANQKTLLPVPVKLRTRAVMRDCRELASGKPGILVKPKVNPLEGDSSLRYGQGQWWKKVGHHKIFHIFFFLRIFSNF